MIAVGVPVSLMSLGHCIRSKGEGKLRVALADGAFDGADLVFAELGFRVEIVLWQFSTIGSFVDHREWNILCASNAVLPSMNSFVFLIDRNADAAVEGVEQAASGTTVVVKLSVAELRREQVKHAGDIVHVVDHLEGDASSLS